jgi:mRNA-degrading endonuclease RelE of RelBE toxin-antitoxin system
MLMEESLYFAKEELKRVDHLIFVSLKYTRTCDVMKSIIERLIACYDHIFDAYLEKLKKDKIIKELPKHPAQKCEMIKNKISDNLPLMNNIEFYMLLRKMHKNNEFTRLSEFRRNVTMVMYIDEEKHEVTIDSITEFYKKTDSFLEEVCKELTPVE